MIFVLKMLFTFVYECKNENHWSLLIIRYSLAITHYSEYKHSLCSSCPYFKVGVARTVWNSHVIMFCSIPLVFSKFGVLQTVNGAAPRSGSQT